MALPDATETRQVIFAKNSDRPAFDCQPLVFRPRRQWPAGARVSAAALELPQVTQTYAHLGSRPYWSMGYESGINEHGLVLGNEAIFTRASRAAAQQYRTAADVPRGLSGLELIRLALERTRSAPEAVALIGRLVEAHGQFGSAVPGKAHPEGSYDNAFIIADRSEAWVLETCGREWAARRWTAGCTSISNQPSLRTEWQRASNGLQATAEQRGWWPAGEPRPFDFAEACADEMVPRQVSHLRLMRSRQLLRERAGSIDAGWMKRIARDHYEGTFLEGPLFSATDPDVLTLCMHDSAAGFTWGNTATSCIVVQPAAPNTVPVFWWTPGPPCNGCYVPFFVAAGGVPPMVARTGSRYGYDSVIPAEQASPDEYSADSYWWRFRRLLEATTGRDRRAPRFAACNREVRTVFDALEADFEVELQHVLARFAEASSPIKGADELRRFSERCVDRVVDAIDTMLRRFGSSP